MLRMLSMISLLLLFLMQGNAQEEKKDTTTKEKKEPKVKTILDIVGKQAKVDSGLFTIYLTDAKLYFEIPDASLQEDMLLVSRIAKVPANLSPYMNAGSKVGEQVVRWSKKGKKILLRVHSYSNVSDESDPIHLSVAANNFEPIVGAFDIKGHNQDSTSYLIDVSSLFTSDIKALSGLSSRLRKEHGVKNLDGKRSMIEEAKSFPINVEVRHIMTYNASDPPAQSKTQTLSMLMNQSLIMLPKEKMKPRYYDERVGWFSVGQIDYSSDALKSDQKRLIRRWKLVPKDIEAYKRGELVEPVKPIVYYLDPATPLKWRPYFRQGIEDWNACFETAGFKNAIIAKDAPTPEEDPDFSPEDARYSVARYVASTTRNAVGPSVSDPRTGEIIESDIIWYHNHLRSYRNRYLLETGAANPKARSLDTPEEEIGEMMRRVISHEIGHALGLPHNMKASSAYPVDSLRSGKFTQEYGIATTIMDYARYNYVAQPGDDNIRFIRQLGPYDHYSINWGYRYLPDANSPDEEKPTLLEWIDEKEGDPVYMFGSGYPRQDPRSQTECIGDDNMLASEYGIQNLRRVSENLMTWTIKDGQNYDDLQELYGEFLGVYRRYIGHVITNVGGIYQTLKTSDQNGDIYEHVSRTDQQRALSFLFRHAFSNHDWLVPEEVVSRIDANNALERISLLQKNFLDALMSGSRMNRMAENEFQNPQDCFSLNDFFNYMYRNLWLVKSRPDHLRRQLHRNYIQNLDKILKNRDGAFVTDLQPLARNQMMKIQELSEDRSGDKDIIGMHYGDLSSQIKEILDTQE